MKRPKRSTLILTGVTFSILLLLWISWGGGLVPQVFVLNKSLSEDPLLAEYPYRFRAVLLASGLATVTRPYNAEVPPRQFLAIVYPELADKAPDDPAVLAALERLKALEMRAVRVVTAHPQADTVEWVLDRAWYDKQGINLPPYIGN